MSMFSLPIIISLFSLGVSLFVASTNYWRSRPKIKVMQSKNENRSWILKSYDGLYAGVKHQSLKPKMESIALIEVIITNDSSLPISILEFHIKGAHPFQSYTYTNENYKVSPKSGGPIHFSSPNSPLNYLQPEFTLEPYTSKRGHILFWMYDKESLQPGTHRMVVVTSRKKFTHKIKISDTFESAEENLYKEPEFLPFE